MSLLSSKSWSGAVRIYRSRRHPSLCFKASSYIKTVPTRGFKSLRIHQEQEHKAVHQGANKEDLSEKHRPYQ